MLMLLNHLRTFTRRDDGQDLLEYALLIALIAIVCVGVIAGAGTAVKNTFSTIAESI